MTTKMKTTNSRTMRPIIDVIATGHNIRQMRRERNMTVAEVQSYPELETPRAIYKWQSGAMLPSIENLLGLSILFKVPMNEIIKVA